MKKLIILSIFILLTANVYASDSALDRALNETDTDTKYKLLHTLLEVYKEKYEKNPNNPQTLQVLGKIYMNTQQYGEAKSILMHQYNLYPENPASHVALGDFYFYFGEYNTALEFYKLALSSGYLKNIDTNFKTAITYEKLADLKNAELYYDICLHLNPDFDKAKNRKILLTAEKQNEIKSFELNENDLSETDDNDEEINNILNNLNIQRDDTLNHKPKRTNKHLLKKKKTQKQEEEILEDNSTNDLE